MPAEPSEDTAVSTHDHIGMTLIAETAGTGATTFVLVHGIGMGRSVFRDASLRLRRHGRVVAVDLPGYGEAPEPDRTPTIERMADLVAGYLAARGSGRVVLVGHSMGSQVATEVVARHPGLVSCLVLVAPTVDRRRRHALAQFARIVRDLVDESPKVLAAGAREYLRAGPHQRRKLRAMLAHRPEDAYPRVTVPTLVIRGERDPVSPHDWCAFVAETLPEATLIEIAGHGHETLIRDAAPAVARILAFAL